MSRWKDGVAIGDGEDSGWSESGDESQEFLFGYVSFVEKIWHMCTRRHVHAYLRLHEGKKLDAS